MFTDRRANTLEMKRRRQPWPKDRHFKILALDGGGIKGIYTAELLKRCEAELGAGAGLSTYFDMIAGTSTGGIIALGLGAGMTTDDICSFYRNDGRQIFPPLPSRWWGRLWQFVAWSARPKMRHNELESALRKRFGDRLLGDSTARLVVPAFMMPKTEIVVFKTDHHEDFCNDHFTPMWRVACSTSAAPTFFRGHEHEESGRVFIDGGVWANNATMVAVIDALTAYDIAPEQVRVLSIGTGNPPFELSMPGVLGGLFAWREVIKAAMYLTTDNATAQATLLLGPEHCLRIEPSDMNAAIMMDDYDNALERLPPGATADFEMNKGRISEFFTDTVLPRERHYSSGAV